MSEIPRPSSDEYGAYYETYVGAVPDGEVLTLWSDLDGRTNELLAELSDDRAQYRYAPDKWSIKEIIGHLVDTERFFAARALWIARGETTPLAGYEQDAQVKVAGFDRRSLADLLADLSQVRRSNQCLFGSFCEEDLARRGVANGFPLTARAVAYILPGHGLHHLGVLEERYTAAFG